jgi:uncharacterized protein YecA (UPF0149 family)
VEAYVDRLEGRRRERLRGVYRNQAAFENALGHADTWDGDERLPATTDGKVNVQALMDRLGLKEADRQWFYKLPELAGPINALASAQGLKAIKSRAQEQVEDEAAVKAIGRARTDNKRLAETLMEVTRERDQLRAQLQMLREGGWVVRTGPVTDDRK